MHATESKPQYYFFQQSMANEKILDAYYLKKRQQNAPT